MNGKVAGVTAWAVSHSTEDEEKVVRALKNAVGAEAEIQYTQTEAHFHQKMLLMHARTGGKNALSNLIRAIGAGNLSRLKESVDERTDDNSTLHFRLDKQSCYLGRPELSATLEPRERKERDAVDVEVKVITYPGGRINAVKFIAELLEEAGHEEQG